MNVDILLDMDRLEIGQDTVYNLLRAYDVNDLVTKFINLNGLHPNLFNNIVEKIYADNLPQNCKISINNVLFDEKKVNAFLNSLDTGHLPKIR